MTYFKHNLSRLHFACETLWFSNRRFSDVKMPIKGKNMSNLFVAYPFRQRASVNVRQSIACTWLLWQNGTYAGPILKHLRYARRFRYVHSHFRNVKNWIVFSRETQRYYGPNKSKAETEQVSQDLSRICLQLGDFYTGKCL